MTRVREAAAHPLPVLLGLAALCLLGPVEIDAVKAVPISLQSLLVLGVALLLGAKRGVGVVVAYLVLGFAGLPVFAEGTSGLAKLWGPTGGFLLAFVVAAGVVGWLADQGRTEGLGRLVGAFLLGHGVIVVPGLVWLEVHSGGEADVLAIAVGLLPGLAVKSLLGAGLVAGGRRWVRRRGHPQHHASGISGS